MDKPSDGYSEYWVKWQKGILQTVILIDSESKDRVKWQKGILKTGYSIRQLFEQVVTS